MIFNKWKKRAYEQLERADKLQRELKKIESTLKEIVSLSESDRVWAKILDYKIEMEKEGKSPRLLFLSEDDYNHVFFKTSAAFIITDLYPNHVLKEGSLGTIYGMRVCHTTGQTRVE